jgi:hypothetical protein
MQHSTPLSISIQSPCNQNWETMTPDGKGKFCSNCNKTIIDFSRLTDTELYQYLQSPNSIHCGRFHNSQLDRPIIPVSVKPKRPWYAIYKPVAAALAFFMLKYSAAATDKKEIATTFSPNNYSKTEKGPIIISGTVRHQNGQPLENAKILLGDRLVATTDKEGRYAFELKEYDMKSYMLTISYEGLTSTVRSYHPSMLSTSYDITLIEYDENCCRTMGIARIHKIAPVEIFFSERKKEFKTFDDEIKQHLATLAVELKNHPEVNVVIVAQSGSSALNRTRQEKLKGYLVETEGIAEERIRFAAEMTSDRMLQDLIVIRAEFE